MMNAKPFLALNAVMAIAALSGCASSVSTFGGENKFNCEVKLEGIPCNSITGTDRNHRAGKLPHQQNAVASPEAVASKMAQLKDQPSISPSTMPGAASGPATQVISPRQMVTANNTGMPLRLSERVLRVWMAPFEDEDGALHDQKYIFLAVTKGSWQLENNRINPINNGYRNVYPLGRSNETNDGETADRRVSAVRADARNQANAAVTNNPNLNTITAPSAAQQRANTLRNAQQDSESQ